MLKRKTPLKRTGFKSKPKPLRPVSAKRQQHWKSPEGKAELEYMRLVKTLPCCICGRPGPSDAHHCISRRFGAKKRSGYDCIPLCKAHHQDGPEAIHNGKESWEREHGPDYNYIEETRKKVDIIRSGK